MEYTNSFDKKIMEYSGNDWEEFVNLFTNEELEQMAHTHLIIDNDKYAPDKESLIEAYLEEWAVEQVRNRTYHGTEHLLRLLYTLCG